MKKIIALLLAVVLLGGVTGIAPAQAAAYTEDELSAKILYVKNLLGIGDEYTEFSPNVWDNNGSQTWSFSWNTSDYGKSIYTNIDADDHISYLSMYENNNGPSQIPEKYSEDYEKVALDFIKKIAPEISGHIKLTDTSLNYYSNSFTYSYMRFENGYPMPDNYVKVTVNHVRNEVESFNASWDYKVKISKPDKIISKKEAASKLSGKLDMELRYIRNYYDDKQGVFLAYIPSDSYFSVDAVTGKIYKEKSYYTDGYAEATKEESEDIAYVRGIEEKGEATLSDAEIKKIKEISDLISKEEAIAVVTSNKDLLLDKSMKQISAYLSSNSERFYWQIRMSDPRPVDYDSNDYYRAYAYATVDAKDGRLLSFSASVKDYYNYEDVENIELKYNKSECIKKFEKFAKNLEPEKFAQTKKTRDNGGYVVYYDYGKDESVYGGRFLEYTRLVNEIPFYNDSITGGVDRVTGKVYSYRVEWSDDLVFPSPEKAISKKAAFDKYLESDEFILKYELTTNDIIYDDDYESTTKSRLCYVTDIRAPYLDAFTGKFLSYDGTEYKPENRNRTYTDVAGHKYEKEIRFISQLVSVVDGDKFEPDKYVTNKFVSDFFEKLWYLPQRAENLKINEKTVKREDIAATIVQMLGYKEISELDIFALNYSDADKISKNKKGAVAIAGALGLFNVKKGGKFKPSAKVTRGEFAYIVAKALVISESRYY